MREGIFDSRGISLLILRTNGCRRTVHQFSSLMAEGGFTPFAPRDAYVQATDKTPDASKATAGRESKSTGRSTATAAIGGDGRANALCRLDR
jgi:hypothetical protein